MLLLLYMFASDTNQTMLYQFPCSRVVALSTIISTAMVIPLGAEDLTERCHTQGRCVRVIYPP